MPPPRTLYQSSLRGFICQSCVSKLLSPRPPWASRNITSKSGGFTPRRLRRAAKPTQNVTSEAGKAADIKYFDQSPDGTQEAVDPEQNATVIHQLDERIAELEKNLEDLREGKTSPEEQEVLQQMSELTDEQREELLNAIGTVEDSHRQEFLKNQRPIYNFDIQHENPSSDSNKRLESFVIFLKKLALGHELNQDQRKELWKRYSMIRKELSSAQVRVSPDFWTFLWAAFSNTVGLKFERLRRLKTLAEDMQQTGVTLSDTQIIVYMEAWYLSGQRKSALDRWRSLTGSMGKETSAVFKPFWVLGIRMLALEGHAQEALDAVAVLFKEAPDSDPRIVIPIINAWITSSDDNRLQKAWLVYQHIRSALFKTMEMKDYDGIAETFLRADLPGLALGVFRDMMTANDEKNGQKVDLGPVLKHDFEKLSLETGRGENLNAVDVRTESIDWTPFQGLARLPSRIRNKFFFGSWIKKLLGEKDVKGALQVIKLMEQYRVRPDAIQLNGVIGTLLRSKNVKGIATGEKMGWEMIKARLEFMAASQRKPAIDAPATLVLSRGKNDYRLAVGALRSTPPATPETLALLIESYRRRNRHDYVEDLWNVLKMSGIRPNTYILNQFLLSYHRVRDYTGAMAIYSIFYHDHNVTPDIDTIKWLWYIMKQDKGGSSSQLSTRWLFARTIRYLPRTVFRNEEKAAIADIYEKVISSFGKVDDQVGTAIAMRAFQQRFGIYPNQQIAEKIVVALAASDGTMPTEKTRFKNRYSPMERRAAINSVLENVMMKRSEELTAKGVDIDEMDEDARGRENIFVMTELLRSLFNAKLETLAEKKARIAARADEKRQLATVQGFAQQKLEWRDVEYRIQINVKQNFKTAGGMMGVPDIEPWDE